MNWPKKIDKWLLQLLTIEIIGLLAIYLAFKES